MNCVRSGVCGLEDCAAAIVCTVISNAVPGKVILDAGSKTLTSDRLSPNPEEGGHGLILEYPEARIVRLSEEHGEVDVSMLSKAPRLGEHVHVIPNHICPCINLQNEVWIRQDDGTLERVQVDARGMLT